MPSLENCYVLGMVPLILLSMHNTGTKYIIAVINFVYVVYVLDTPFAMSRSPLAHSPTKSLTSRSSELEDICEERGMEQNEENDRNPDNPGGSGGQNSFPTYGTVQDETEHQAAPLVQEKNAKKRHKTSPVVSLASFGDVSALLSKFSLRANENTRKCIQAVLGWV